jgi:hypothetical protein
MRGAKQHHPSRWSTVIGRNKQRWAVSTACYRKSDLSITHFDAIIGPILIGFRRIVANNTIFPPLVTALLLFLNSCSPFIALSLNSSGRLVELLPIDVDRRDPERKEFGSLVLMSAFQLSSRDSRFGGLSGLSIGTDGRLYAVTDRGDWARTELDSDGRLLDLIEWQIEPVLTPEGTPVSGLFTDAEALSRAPDGSFIVAFEQVHRVWRYPPPPATLRSPPVSIAVPSEIAKAPNNGGLEGIAILRDGRLLALTEEFQNADGSFKSWLIENGRFGELSYLPSDGFRVTDCAALSSGDVIVLERRYPVLGNWAARLKLVAAGSVRAGAMLVGKEILRLDPPVAVDNFEGVAVHEDPIRGPMIYLISDDNFHPLQRTLLFQFRLPRSGK